MRPEEKSRIRRSPACSQDPFAPVMTRGVRAPCADQETRTWSLVSRAIAEVSTGRLVSSAMRKTSIPLPCAYRLPGLAAKHDVASHARSGAARGCLGDRIDLDLG